MEWFNVFGLVIMIIIMIPNVIFMARNKDGFENNCKNRAVKIIEQIGRIGCFIFMIFNIPNTGFGFRSGGAFVAYLIIDSVLVLAYCVSWIIFRGKRGRARSLALSVLPSAVFLFSAALSNSYPLLAFSILFAPTHILISYKNAE